MRLRNLTPLLLLVIIILSSCKIKNDDFRFYECKYELIDYGFSPKNNRWLSNKKEALNAKLIFEDSPLNRRDLDSLYNTTAQYVFIIGGGGNFVDYKECFVKIKNDSLIINYKYIPESSSSGERASSLICLEVNKLKYPDYKKMKIFFELK